MNLDGPRDGRDDSALADERALLRALRRGESDAGHRFACRYYPGVYRYLCHLTGRPELAADLTQETFLKAWRHLDRFEPRAPLGVWLHRIARREFLQALRAERVTLALEAIAEVPDRSTASMPETVALHDGVRALPLPEREAVVLHYLEGYSCAEVARIVRASESAVKYRLSAARARLRRDLGEGDLDYLNASATTRPIEEGEMPSDKLTRRDFLSTAAGAGAAALAGPIESEVVDDRLARARLTLAVKAMALADLCDDLRARTGVHLSARPSVADEKVTLFCRDLPLRDVMRQLSRAFGYAWARAGTPGKYRYELEQDLRGQLLEEELRNRDRAQALLALEAEIERYRPLLGLTPDEAHERLARATPAEKRLLQPLAGRGWGPLQMYQRLSAQDQAALRAGQELRFSAEPKPGERPLPPEVARGVLQGLRDRRIIRLGDGTLGHGSAQDHPDAPAPAAVPEARALVTLKIRQSELGQFTLSGEAGFFARSRPNGPVETANTGDDGPVAVGMSPASHEPRNRALNAKHARDRSLQSAVTVEPEPAVAATAEGDATEAKVTTADVLEALHRATGLPIVADYYTRLFPLAAATVRGRPLFDTLCDLSDLLRMRWSRDEEWLRFRGATYFDDRLKEVPNRLLSRWTAARQRQGALALENLVEIAQLTDAQLDAADMAEGARRLHGLSEWELARNWALRRHLRFLGEFTPAQRDETLSPAGLAFSRMPLAQQQRFLAIALEWDERPLASLEELAGAALRVEYTRPGFYEWRVPKGGASWLQWVEPAASGRRAPRPPIRGRSREAVLQAARQLDPQALARMHRAALRVKPDLLLAEMTPHEAQIVPTLLDLTILYLPGASHERQIKVFHLNSQSAYGTW